MTHQIKAGMYVKEPDGFRKILGVTDDVIFLSLHWEAKDAGRQITKDRMESFGKIITKACMTANGFTPCTPAEAGIVEAWRPKKDELFWVVCSDGTPNSYQWREDSTDAVWHAIGNCFPSEAEAQAAADKFKKVLAG